MIINATDCVSIEAHWQRFGSKLSNSCYSGTSHNGPSHEQTTSITDTGCGTIEITTELVFNQPPTSRCFLIPDSGQAACSKLTNSVQQCRL